MTSEEYLELGLVYIKEKMWSQALACLRSAEKAFEREKQKVPAALDSYLALAIAMTGGNLDEALRRARSGLDKACYQPDYYLNVGRIYLKIRDKEKAVQAFQLGLQLDERHPGLTQELKRLGIRKTPVLQFLPRNHVLNKYLGKIRRLDVAKR